MSPLTLIMLIRCIVLCGKKKITTFLDDHHVTDAGSSNYSEAQNESSYQDGGVNWDQFPQRVFKQCVGVFHVQHQLPARSSAW